MTISENRLKIIKSWSSALVIKSPQSPGYRGEYWYGRLFINRNGPGGVIGPYTTETSIIYEAYNLVKESVWDIVKDIER